MSIITSIKKEIVMSKDVKIKGYPFEWLENLITVKLNPEQTALQDIPASEIEIAENKLSFEIWKLLNKLKVRTFGRSEKKVIAFVSHYHETIVSLIRQAKSNMANCEIANLVALNEKVIMSLEDLLREVESRYFKYLQQSRTNETVDEQYEANFKVLCQLSVDQLGILLKAADEVKLILSRSISLIFRSLVPFLSTQKIKNISWMSMRKGTYQFNPNDIDVVVNVLERMIKKIKGYY